MCLSDLKHATPACTFESVCVLDVYKQMLDNCYALFRMHAGDAAAGASIAEVRCVRVARGDKNG